MKNGIKISFYTPFLQVKWTLDSGCHAQSFTLLPIMYTVLFSQSVVSSSLVTPWTTICLVPLSMGFPRQESWSGLPCPPPGDLPDSGIETVSLISPVLAGSLPLASLQKPSFSLLLLLSHFSHVRPSVTPWTAAYQASPSMGFSRQEHWSGLPFPSPGDLPNPGMEPGSPALEADALTSGPPGKP